ncbi:kinase-like domain-containing protein [Hyaloraphidium curvatum]|nr:kinase-like domain-containing protein [Hyaloraphidium curvatum]
MMTPEEAEGRPSSDPAALEVVDIGVPLPSPGGEANGAAEGPPGEKPASPLLAPILGLFGGRPGSGPLGSPVEGAVSPRSPVAVPQQGPSYLERNARRRKEFRELGTLAYGAQSRVALAVHLPTADRVALKIHAKPWQITAALWGPTVVERALEDALRETAFNYRLAGHPHVLPLLDAFETPEEFVMVFPFARGGTLRALLDERASLPRDKAKPLLTERESAAVAACLLSALVRAHSLGIVHRDVKPENCLFRATGEPASAVLGDWGVADQVRLPPAGRALERRETDTAGALAGRPTPPRPALQQPTVGAPPSSPPPEPHLPTPADTITPIPAPGHPPPPSRRPSHGLLTAPAGTPSSMAPEILSDLPYGPKADVWSLGCLVYACACGHGPFAYPPARDWGDIRARIVAGVPFAEPEWKGVGEGMRGFVKGCLTLSTRERWDAKRALGDGWLEEALGKEGLAEILDRAGAGAEGGKV